MHFDIVVIGMGVMGSAVAQSAAARGLRVCALDRWSPPHRFGSSHGATRVTRAAYFEHPLYVPLVRRATELWRAAERSAGRILMQRTGALMLGRPDGEIIAGTLASATTHDVPHELLGHDALAHRFPALRPPAGTVGVLEPGGGLLFVDRCIEVLHTLAREAGATLCPGRPARAWHASDRGTTVETPDGPVHAAHLVIAAGAWLAELVPELAPHLTIERQVTHWFEPRAGARLGADDFPVTLWSLADGRVFYTCPDTGDGFKFAFHHGGAATDPYSVHAPGPDETAQAADVLRAVIPDAAGEHVRSERCLYTNTPDLHFLVDRHPSEPRVVLVSACSGHGFKFATVIGELVADLAAGSEPAFDLTPFRGDRLGHDPVTAAAAPFTHDA